MKVYNIENKNLKISFVEYGASITSFYDKRLKRNIIYSYDDINDYIKNPDFLGTIIGRSAGRIEKGIIKVDSKKYQLTKNFLGKHNLHGGNGLHTKRFNVVERSDTEIVFHYHSKDLEEGFPGELDIYIRYKLEDNKLILKINATPKINTYLNMTSHMSFNLSEEKDILNHDLYINSSNLFKVNKELIPVKIKPCNEFFSFKETKKVGRDITKPDKDLIIQKGYDTPYLLDDFNINKPQVKLEVSDLLLNIYTNQKVLVLYTGNYYKEKHKAISLEFQGIPNPLKFKEFKNENITLKDKIYENIIVYELLSKNI